MKILNSDLDETATGTLAKAFTSNWKKKSEKCKIKLTSTFFFDGKHPNW